MRYFCLFHSLVLKGKLKGCVGLPSKNKYKYEVDLRWKRRKSCWTAHNRNWSWWNASGLWGMRSQGGLSSFFPCIYRQSSRTWTRHVLFMAIWFSVPLCLLASHSHLHNCSLISLCSSSSPLLSSRSSYMLQLVLHFTTFYCLCFVLHHHAVALSSFGGCVPS